MEVPYLKDGMKQSPTRAPQTRDAQRVRIRALQMKLERSVSTLLHTPYHLERGG